MLKTKSGLPEHCVWNVDRDGRRRRVRFRWRGVSGYLTGVPWSEGFMAQHAAMMERAAARAATTEIGAARTIPGSVNALIVSYYKYILPTVSPRTAQSRRQMLESFRKTYGNALIHQTKREHILKIIATKAATPHAANNLRATLRSLFEHAVALEWISDNPTLGVKRVRTVDTGGYHCWLDSEIVQYRAHWPRGTMQRLTMELALELTLRCEDVCGLGPQHRRPSTADAPHGLFDLRHSKNDSRTFIPISDELAATITAMGPLAHLTYVTALRGPPRPRSPKQLSDSFRAWCAAAGLPHCTMHGLRKGNLRRHADAGASTKELQALGGHKSTRVLERYVENADRARLAVSAMAKLKAAKAAG
jgi:hypothetical protein